VVETVRVGLGLRSLLLVLLVGRNSPNRPSFWGFLLILNVRYLGKLGSNSSPEDFVL
jgi:hypothetical protein